jgi:hypothetical protein
VVEIKLCCAEFECVRGEKREFEEIKEEIKLRKNAPLGWKAGNVCLLENLTYCKAQKK